jgi:hypothetical protein
MQLSPAVRYFLLLKTQCGLHSTLFSNTVYVPLIRETYEGESKIIRTVATYCAVGYSTGWT